MNRSVQPELWTPQLNNVPLVNQSFLDNGMELFVIKVENLDLVRIDFMFSGGVWVQNHPLQALLALSNIKEGTIHKHSSEVNEILDFYGATFSTTVSKTFSLLTVVCLAKYIIPVIELTREIILSPIYDLTELQIKLQQMKASYDIQSHQVKTQAERLFFNTLFGKRHPMSSFPETHDFEMHDNTLLFEYYKKYIGSSNCKLIVSGNTSTDVLEAINDFWGCDKWGADVVVENLDMKLASYDINTVNEISGRFDYEMQFPTVQSHVFSGCVFEKLHNKRKAVMILANCLLGGYFGSRLMKNIREEKGLTYGIYSQILNNNHFNVLCISTDTNIQMTDVVIEEIKHEIDVLRNINVSVNELDVVKNYYAGTICRAYETNLSFAARLVKKIAAHEKIDDVFETLKFFEQIQPNDIMDFFDEFCDVERFLWSVASSKK